MAPGVTDLGLGRLAETSFGDHRSLLFDGVGLGAADLHAQAVRLAGGSCGRRPGRPG